MNYPLEVALLSAFHGLNRHLEIGLRVVHARKPIRFQLNLPAFDPEDKDLNQISYNS